MFVEDINPVFLEVWLFRIGVFPVRIKFRGEAVPVTGSVRATTGVRVVLIIGTKGCESEGTRTQRAWNSNGSPSMFPQVGKLFHKSTSLSYRTNHPKGYYLAPKSCEAPTVSSMLRPQ